MKVPYSERSSEPRCSPSRGCFPARGSDKRRQGQVWAGYRAAKSHCPERRRLWAKTEGNISRNAIARYGWAPRGQRPQARAETSCAETGRSRQSALACRRGPHGQKESTTMMHDDGKSDKPIVPAKGANKEQGRPCSAECLEERGLAKGNMGEQTRFWTQGQIDLQHALDRIREVARRDKGERFTALWHHKQWLPPPRITHPYPHVRLKTS